MEIAQTISLIKARDESGLSDLYDHYAAALNGIINRIVGSEAIAEEVLQQTFLKIWEKIEQYDEAKSSLFTWMARIARNSAIDKVRLKKFQNAEQTESWEAKHNDSRVVSTDHAGIDTTKLLSKLDQKYKEVIDCIYLQGYSQSEAAKKLAIPLATVKNRLRSALLQLRQELSEEKALFMSSIILILISILTCL